MSIHPEKIKVIGFDADDALWINEPYYRESEEQFCRLLKKYSSEENTMRHLLEIEIGNLELYGYGTKAFMLSMMETAVSVSAGKVTAAEIAQIIELGKAQINRKNDLLPGVIEVLTALSPHFRLIVATKGDLLDQERKLSNSGIARFFHHIEIMSHKKEENYRKLLSHLDIPAGRFLMIGNSLKSDVLPVVNLGGYAIHVPYHITWFHEEVHPDQVPRSRFLSVSSLAGVLPALGIPSSAQNEDHHQPD